MARARGTARRSTGGLAHRRRDSVCRHNSWCLSQEKESQPEPLSRDRRALSALPETSVLPQAAGSPRLPMARTKQTARQSTGGRAPRTQLASTSCTWTFDDSRRLRLEEESQPKPLYKYQQSLSASSEAPVVSQAAGPPRLSPDTLNSASQTVDIMRLCGRQAYMLRLQQESLEEQKKIVERENESQPNPITMPHGRYEHSVTQTLKSSGAALREAVAVQQESCMLLGKLPLELREEIFNLVLGTDSTLHLISRVKRVGHVKCYMQVENPPHPNVTCGNCSRTIRNASYLQDENVRKTTAISHIELALLQTCKQAYREGIRLLYSRPTFAFDHPETLNWLARTVPPRRLSSITRLTLSLKEAANYSGLKATHKSPFRVKVPTPRVARNDGDLLRYWDPAWRTILCDMTNLRHLTVTLVGAKYDDETYTEPVLKPLLELKGLMTFQLKLEGESPRGSPLARLESLIGRSETLRTILENATSIVDGDKRPTEDLDWGRRKRKPENLNWGPAEREKRRRKIPYDLRSFRP